MIVWREKSFKFSPEPRQNVTRDNVWIRLNSAHCMKIRCYFLLNIKHGASQLYWGCPPNTTMRPPGGETGGGYGRGVEPLWGPGGGAGGLQLSSAGTDTSHLMKWLNDFFLNVEEMELARTALACIQLHFNHRFRTIIYSGGARTSRQPGHFQSAML